MEDAKEIRNGQILDLITLSEFLERGALSTSFLDTSLVVSTPSLDFLSNFLPLSESLGLEKALRPQAGPW